MAEKQTVWVVWDQLQEKVLHVASTDALAGKWAQSHVAPRAAYHIDWTEFEIDGEADTPVQVESDG